MAIKIVNPQVVSFSPVSTAEVGQTIKVKQVDENNKPIEWEATDFPEGVKSWNDLEDKPFYDEKVTIDWDGDTEGRTTIDLGSNIKPCHVSDRVLTAEDLIGAEFTINEDGVSKTLTIAAEAVVNPVEGLVMLVTDIGIISAVAGTYDGVEFPKGGTYFTRGEGDIVAYVESLSFNSSKQLDPKYIAQPDFVQNDEAKGGYIKNRPVYEKVENLGDTITWDGTPNEDVVTIPGNEYVAYYRISENVPTEEELTTGQISVKGFGDFALQELVIATAIPGLLFVATSSINDGGLPFLVVNLADGFHFEMDGIALDVKKKGIYSFYVVDDMYQPDGSVVKDEGFVTSLSIPNYNFTKTEIKKLDPKYLPDGGFGYTVKESVKDTLTWDGSTGAFTLEEIEAELEGNVLLYHASNSTPSEEEFTTAEIGMELSSGGEVTRIVLPFERLRFTQVGEDVSLVTYAESTSIEHNLMVVAYKDNATALLGVNITISQKGIYFIHTIDEDDGYSAYTYSLTIPGYTFTKETVHKIDKKYLPDNLPVVELTTPVNSDFEGFTDAENVAITAAAATGMPVLFKGTFMEVALAIVFTNYGGALVSALGLMMLGLQRTDEGNWIPFIEDNTDNMSYLMQAVPDMQNRVYEHDTAIENLQKNPVVPKATASDNGKFLQVVNGAYALVALQDLSKEGL